MHTQLQDWSLSSHLVRSLLMKQAASSMSDRDSGTLPEWGVCWVYNVERREVVLPSSSHGFSRVTFFLRCHVTPSAKEKKKDLLVPREISGGRRDCWERFRNT